MMMKAAQHLLYCCYQRTGLLHCDLVGIITGESSSIWLGTRSDVAAAVVGQNKNEILQ
jgi:hypothetical protein